MSLAPLPSNIFLPVPHGDWMDELKRLSGCSSDSDTISPALNAYADYLEMIRLKGRCYAQRPNGEILYLDPESIAGDLPQRHPVHAVSRNFSMTAGTPKLVHANSFLPRLKNIEDTLVVAPEIALFKALHFYAWFLTEKIDFKSQIFKDLPAEGPQPWRNVKICNPPPFINDIHTMKPAERDRLQRHSRYRLV